jgi:hypothetical protein
MDLVAGHYIGRVDGPENAVTADPGRPMYQTLQSRRRFLGSEFLKRADPRVDQQNDQNEHTARNLRHRERHRRRHQQQIDEGTFELPYEQHQRAGRLRIWKPVRPELFKAFCGFLGGEPVAEVCVCLHDRRE